jgi:hypothetical protein
VQIDARMQRPEDFGKIIVARKNNVAVRVDQVARVADGAQEIDSLALYNGERTLLLTVQKAQDENTIQVVDGLKKTVEEMQKLMDDETWFFGQEIVDNGFSSAVDNTGTDMKATANRASSMGLVQTEYKRHAAMWAHPDMVDKEMGASKANAERLVKAGKVNKDDPWSKLTAAEQDKLLGPQGDDWANFKLWHLVQDDEVAPKTKERYKYPYGKDGVVYRSALRSVASRAAQNDLQELSDWASALVKKIDAKGENAVNKDEVLAWLKNNPGVPLTELAAAVGQGQMVVTEKHAKAIALAEGFLAMKIDDPLATMKAMQASLDAVDTDRVKNALDTAFGAEKEADGKPNLLRAHAGQMFGSVKFADMASKIEEFKKDPVALNLAGQRMDVTSGQNLFRTEPKADEPADVGGVPTMKV